MQQAYESRSTKQPINKMNYGVCVVSPTKTGLFYRSLRVCIGKGGMIDIKNRNARVENLPMDAGGLLRPLV